MCLFLIGLVVFSICPTKAAIIWQEDFECELTDLTDWILHGWQTNSTNHFEQTPDSGFTIQGGALTGPNSTSFNNGSFAYHNCSLAYGTWSFDWIISVRTTYDLIHLVYSDPINQLNFTGKTMDEYVLSVKTYTLILASTATGAGRGIHLFVTTGNASNMDKELATYDFGSDLTGLHQVQITRDERGEFKVYFDSELVMQVTDNTYTTSEYFNFASIKGDSQIDNIVVSDEILSTTIVTSTTTESDSTIESKSTSAPSSSSNVTFLFIIATIVVIVFLRRLNVYNE